MAENERGKRTLTRSPNYPAIDIGRAIERVRTLYSTERQHSMSAVQAVKHWGYSTLNSPGGGQLAALARFGLVDDEGTKDDRTVRVTDLAVKILEHPELAERESAVREAAMLPTVHQDMWQKYGADLPSEDNLRWFLTRERGFSENGAKDFIKEYRATVEFAKLGTAADDEVVSPTPDPGGEAGLATSAATHSDVPAQPQPLSVAPPGQMPPISFPLASGKIVSVSGLGDLSEAEWAQFMAVLAALKPSLVRTGTAVADTDPSGDLPEG